MATTTNFGWETPDDTDLVKDGALAIRTLGSAIDTSLVDLKGGTTGQVLSKTSNTDMDFTWVTSDDANAIQNAIVDAKGDLITATAADTPARLAVGTNGQFLSADSTTATGLKWATISTALPTARAVPASSQSITSGVATKITLGTENWDTDNNFASSRFTATIAGYYQVNSAVQLNTGSNVELYSWIYKNGAVYTENYSTGTAYNTLFSATAVYLAVDDYIEFYCRHNGASAVSLVQAVVFLDVTGIRS